ncbi:MAG TPA: DUF4390 domain-containing protein [Nitrospiria bacterium]|nr:DUF4390 domain-containing protein [Nitrospiria bacterium]
MTGRNRKTRRIVSAVLAAVLILLPWVAPPARAGDERIAGLTASVIDNGTVSVTADLIRWYNQNLRDDLNNGIPKDLYYYLLLKKRQPGWFDEEMVSKTIKHTIKYDVLKKQYSITTRADEKTTQKTVESFDEMAQLISRIDHVKIATSVLLNPRHTYYVSVKAEMRATNVPFYLEYILFFIPALELDTPWADSAPFYSPGRAP